MLLDHRNTLVGLVSAIATLAVAPAASAQERAGVVTTLEGKVTVVRASSPEMSPLKFRDAVFVRDRIATGKDAFARILLGGRAVVTIREYSAVTITEVPGVATVDVGSGRVAVAVARERMRPGDLVEVRTPNAVAGIRGTVIVAEVFDARRSVITVLKGVIDVTRLDAGRAAGPSTVLNALQQVTIGGAVSAPLPVPSDAAQRMGAEFRAVPLRRVPDVTTAAVGQVEMERVAKDLGVVAGAPGSTGKATSAQGDQSGGDSGKGKSAQSDQPSGDSDKGKGTQSGTATVSTGSGGAVSGSSSPASNAAGSATATPSPAPVAAAPVTTTVPPTTAPIATPVGTCACTASVVPLPSGASPLSLMRDIPDLGSLRELKLDKGDRDNGKSGKKR
jgi:hypothetical protein